MPIGNATQGFYVSIYILQTLNSKSVTRYGQNHKHIGAMDTYNTVPVLDVNSASVPLGHSSPVSVNTSWYVKSIQL